MYKTLILLAYLTVPNAAQAGPNDYSEREAAVVHPVFYTVDFTVEGYTVVSTSKKTAVVRPVAPFHQTQPSVTHELLHHDTGVSPKLLLAQLTKQIDEQLNAPTIPKTLP